MDAVIYLFLLFLGSLIGAAIGFTIALFIRIKELDNIYDEVDDLRESYLTTIDEDDDIIRRQTEAIHNTYIELVRMRNRGVNCLDEVIGYLGNALED